jgi:hypothetical protein
LKNWIFTKIYLRHLLNNIEYYLTIYDEIIKQSLLLTEKDKSEVILIDYGCGNGLLGMYAKFCGIKKVILVDINEPLLNSAKVISSIIQIEIDSFILGEIDDLPKLDFSKYAGIIIGSDVIEHIYDLDIFFNKISKMNSKMITCFTTGSNPNNMWKVKSLKKMQIKDERYGGSLEDEMLYGAKACMPFYDVRKIIIEENFKNILQADIEELTKRTRGKNKNDIILETEKYLITKTFPIELEDKTNTCDPITGSWTERVLKIDEYKKVYTQNGFNIRIENGFYNSINNSLMKNIVLKMVNFIINISNYTGKYFAPFIIIYGSKNTK